MIITMTTEDTPPLVHQSNNECCQKSFELIAYTFLQSVSIEVHHHLDFLDFFWYLYQTHRGNTPAIIESSYENAWSKKASVINIQAGETFLVNKDCLFKVLPHRRGHENWKNLYAFVAHVVDSTYDVNDILTLGYMPFHRKLDMVNFQKYAWKAPWPKEAINFVRNSLGRVCLPSTTGKTYDFTRSGIVYDITHFFILSIVLNTYSTFRQISSLSCRFDDHY
jgi:hypothetical protein